MNVLLKASIRGLLQIRKYGYVNENMEEKKTYVILQISFFLSTRPFLM